MPLITVPEYAKRQGVSVQAIYQRIKRGSIEVVIEDGIKLIEVPAKAKKKRVKGQCKHYKQTIKALKRDIERIVNDKDQAYRQLEKLFDKVLSLNTLALPSPVIEVKPLKKSKGKKRK